MMKVLKVGIILLLVVAFVVSIHAQENPDQDDNLVYVTAVAWSHDGSKMAAVGIQPPGVKGYLRVIDVTTGQTLYALDPNPGGFTSVAWSPDDRFIAAGGYDQVVWVIDVATGNHVASLWGHQSTVNAVDWNSDGTRLVSGGNWDQKVILWDMTTYEQIRMVEAGDIWSVEFSPDNRRIAVGSIFGLAVFPADLDISREDPVWFSELYIGGLAWSHDGTRIAFGTQAFTNKAAKLYILDSANGILLSELATGDNVVSNVIWSPNDDLIITSSLDGFVRVWDSNSGGEPGNFPSVTRYPVHISFSPYGGRLAYGGTLPGTTAASTAVMQTNSQGVTQLASGAVQIVVPAPSLERLQTIGHRCNAPQNVMRTLNTPEQLPAFVTQIRALTAAQIPPGCAADLIAVAEALQNQ